MLTMQNFNRSLWMAAIVVTIALVGAKCLSAQDDSLQEQSEQENKSPAIQAVESVGGRVMQISAQSPDREVNVSLVGDKVNDELVAQIASIENVVWLNLARTKITDAGLKPIAQLKSIRKLHLENTAISDDALQYLSALENLEYLNVYGTKITDKGLEHLKPLKNLKKLYVWQTGVTEDGMKQLNAALPQLQITAGVSLQAVETEEKKDKSETEESDKNAESDKKQDKQPAP